MKHKGTWILKVLMNSWLQIQQIWNEIFTFITSYMVCTYRTFKQINQFIIKYQATWFPFVATAIAVVILLTKLTLFGLNQFVFLLLCRNILNVGYGHSMAKQTTKLRRKMTVAQILRNIFSCSLISFYLLPICFCVAVLSLPHLWNALAGEMNSDETVLVILQNILSSDTKHRTCIAMCCKELTSSCQLSLTCLFIMISWCVFVILTDSIVLLLLTDLDQTMDSFLKIHYFWLNELFFNVWGR